MSTRILIVDDSIHVRRALRTCLQLNPGWEVCAEAEDGRAGVEAAQTENPDVVLLDYSMPGMSGLEAAREIATASPKIPVLLFTMYASPQLTALAEEAGVRAVISKGVGGVDAIVKAIQELVHK